MPAAKLFLSAADIASITGSSLRSAQYMMAMFRKKGQVIYIGTTKKSCRVDVTKFSEFLSKQDGVNVIERRQSIVEMLREQRRCK